jgi:hypothetical protein
VPPQEETKNWWEKAKDFVQENIVQPVQEAITPITTTTTPSNEPDIFIVTTAPQEKNWWEDPLSTVFPFVEKNIIQPVKNTWNLVTPVAPSKKVPTPSPENPLACTPDNPWGIPRNNPDTQTALDWLIGLYENDNLPGNTAMDRTQCILNATSDGDGLAQKVLKFVFGGDPPHSHFNSNLAPGDSGFDPNYQDSSMWPSSGNQDGHFLTALDLSLWANDNSESELGRYVRGRFALASIIGHEMVGDYVGGREAAPFIQTGVGLLSNWLTFGAVNKWFLSGEDENFEKIVYSPVTVAILKMVVKASPWIQNIEDIPPGPDLLRQGNSVQDLRLSYEGWVAGQQLTNPTLPPVPLLPYESPVPYPGENFDIQTTKGFAQWLKHNLK